MIQRGGLFTGKLIESERQGIIFLYLGISPFPQKKKKAYFFEFESKIFHNIGPVKCVLHHKVNPHNKIKLIIYFKNLIIKKLYIFLCQISFK